MSKISWVMASRDDGFGGTLEGVNNFNLKRINICLGSILALGREDEIIIVDFCSSGKPLKESLSHLPVRVITVDKGLLNLLQEDIPGQKLPFYEYVAKDIGIRHAKNDLIIACNPDNIFPLTNFDEVIKDLEKGFIAKAVRLEIVSEYAKLDIPTLVGMANKDEFIVSQRFTTAGGDFSGFKKSIYEDIGGYPYLHIDWHIDNVFFDLARLKGYEFAQSYSHYHIFHDGTIYAPLKNHDFEHAKIINKKIIERIEEYVLA